MRHSIKPRLLRQNGLSISAKELIPSHTNDDHSYNEDWLQDLLHKNPDLLPVSAFEASFERIIGVARELPTPVGPLDNLFVTPDGDLVLVECKLWKNPEARRKVIAQIIDYAAAISEWGYEDLANAINKANGTNISDPLYNIVQTYAEIQDEAAFIDTVTKNLRFGRHLLLIVGDGIREDMERITDFLQQKAGLHFTLGLMEIGIFKLPEDSGILVIPNILLKTTIIERGIIRFDGPVSRISDPEPTLHSKPISSNSSRGEDLTEIKFFEAMQTQAPQIVDWLKARLNEMKKLGMTWDIKKSLLPRYSPDGLSDFNFGYIKPDGRFYTNNATWLSKNQRLRHISEDYVTRLASIIPNSHIEKATDGSWKIYVGEQILHLSSLIGLEKEFIEILASYIRSINKALSSETAE